MDFDFDAPLERRGGDSAKWNRYAGSDVLPLWVADMDFAAPPAVIEALRRRVEQGVFGYCEPWPALVEAVVKALQRDHGWRIDPEWLIWLPGLVTGLNVVSRAVGEPGDAVLTATPIYPPFLSAPRYQGRDVLTAPLVLDGATWRLDWERLEAAVIPRTRLFLLCNPHNPVGRVYTRAELLEVAAFCERHELVLCSDEIHCGLVLEPGLAHLPVAMLDEGIARRTITLMAASKTFNIPGLGCAFAIVPDAGLRARVHAAMRGIVPHVNVLGLAATAAAYRHGEPWRRALLEYLRGNRDLVLAALATLPGLKTTPVQATYLAWIDATGLGVEDPHRFLERAGVGLSDGRDFGAPGFLRLNFGTTRRILAEASARMARACGAP